jgi:transcriptional regulator with XRE-family HTH domain
MMPPIVLRTSSAMQTLERHTATPYSATTHFVTHRKMTREEHLTSLRERLGLAVQRQRQIHGLSQAELARLAKLSLKYIGQIERGEANPSMEALERLSDALEWDPFELPLREQDTLPEGVRTLLLAELTHMQHLVQTAISWVQTLDAAMVRRASHPDPQPSIAPSPTPPVEEDPPRLRGRPVKSAPRRRGR